MPKNKIEDLRNILFETMEKLMDQDEPMDIDRARAVSAIAQTVINTAKVEVDFMKLTGAGGSTFIQGGQQPQRQLAAVKPETRTLPVSPRGYEELCTRCPLPDCNELSPDCLIQIERRAA